MSWGALDTLAVLLISVGFYKQIYEEWIPRGLTDTSYIALLAFGLGSGLEAVVNFHMRDWWLSVVNAPAALTALVFITLKLRDRRRSRRRR